MAFVHGIVPSRPRVEASRKSKIYCRCFRLQRTSAILLPSRLFADIKASSRLNLAQRELAAPVGLPAVASVGPAGKRSTRRREQTSPENHQAAGS
jgi:hypothetical protein